MQSKENTPWRPPAARPAAEHSGMEPAPATMAAAAPLQQRARNGGLSEKPPAVNHASPVQRMVEDIDIEVQDLSHKVSKPGRLTYWYQRDKSGELHPRYGLFSSLSMSGWIKVGTAHKLDVWQKNSDMLAEQGTKLMGQMKETKASVIEIKEQVKANTEQLLKAEEELDKYISNWVEQHISAKKILLSLLGISAVGVAAIYGLSLVSIPASVYLAVAGLSELVGIYYTVRWVKDKMLPGIAKIVLLGVNSATMLTAVFSIAYALFNSMPINHVMWGALPFGLLISELVRYLYVLRERKRQDILNRITREDSPSSDNKDQDRRSGYDSIPHV